MFVKAYNHTGRNRALDALRGFALFGVLVANIYLFNCYTGDLPAYLSTFSDKMNILTSFVVQFFFRGRFYPIFALLFGLGMGMQFLKQSNTEAAYKLLLRRLLVLLLIGILHYVFVWDGDILIRYSLAGIVALAFINLKKHLILTAAVTVYAIHSFYAYQISEILVLTHTLTTIPVIELNYPALVLFRIKGLPTSYESIESLFYSIKVFSFILFGLYFSKGSILRHYDKVRWLNTLLILVLIRITTAFLAFSLDRFTSLSTTLIWLSFLNYLLNPSIYIAAFMFVAGNKWFDKPVAILACLGRMSLSNYILQNVVLGLIFYGYGLEQYQQWQLWQLMLFAVVLFFVQACLSYWWLRYHAQGPLEKFWRFLTYNRTAPEVSVK
ncbi:DUF418 domain-containing protein [Pontibacter sp. MBLB2868]|uniref:DUF418 domain-containing protein n=1 Tax=Pontibacter sp. MBLB2868 TaxID=3451555 RepID=UPI003F756CB4